MHTADLPLIGLLPGEATGIGPELVAKLLFGRQAADLARFIVIGDERVLRWGEQIAGVNLPAYHKLTGKFRREDCTGETMLFDLGNLNPNKLQLTTGKVNLASGEATAQTLTAALQLAACKQIDAIVYAPLCKEVLVWEGRHFDEEIQLFADLLNCKQQVGVVNYMDGLWFTRITSHVALKEVSSYVTRERVFDKIIFTNGTLLKAGIEQPKIAVAALNPHAGEGGMFGDEENESIRPAVEQARQQGIGVYGPFPADTVFLKIKRKEYHALISMYHDQAQIGIKLLGFQRGVTINGGLPVVLTTPAHGTALDIAGKGQADPQGLLEAVKVACRLASAGKPGGSPD